MTLRVEFPHRGGTLGAIWTAVGEAGGMVGAVDIAGCGKTGASGHHGERTATSEHGAAGIVETVEALDRDARRKYLGRRS